MGKIKLPKSLLKVVLFHRKKHKKSAPPGAAWQYDVNELLAAAENGSAYPSSPPMSPSVSLAQNEDHCHGVNTLSDLVGQRQRQANEDAASPVTEPASPARSISSFVAAGSPLFPLIEGDNSHHNSPVASLARQPNEQFVSKSDSLSHSFMVNTGGVNEVKEEDSRQEMIFPASKMSATDVIDNDQLVNPHTIPAATDTTAPMADITASSSNAKKVKFSMRGEEALQRAIAHQKRIFPKASMRLDAISDTSFENIEEAEQSKMTSPGNFTSLENIKKTAAPKKESGQRMASLNDFLSKQSSKEVAVEQIVVSPDDFLAKDSDTSPSRLACHLKAMERGESVSSLNVIYESQPTSKLVDQEKEKLPSSVKEEREQVLELQINDECQERSLGQTAYTIHSKLQDCKPQEGPSKINIQFFILLLCPTSRIFELIKISASDNLHNESTTDDILKLIPQKCADERLLQKKHLGFVRPSDRVDFLELRAKAFDRAMDVREKQQEDNCWGEESDCWPSLNTIHEDDVLVAILVGYSGYQMSKISKPILRNSKIRQIIHIRSKKSDSTNINHRDTYNDSLTTSNRPTRSSRRRRYRGSERSSKDDSMSSRSEHAVPVVNWVPVEIDLNHNEDYSVISGMTLRKTRTKSSSSSKESSNHGKENNRNSPLSQKLEHLLEKLHNVDDGITAGTGASSIGGSKLSIAANEEEDATTAEDVAADDTTETMVGEVRPSPDAKFRMTPKMVVNEITLNIKDIFADHDVETVAVDAEDNGSDDETFATARSRCSTKSMRSVHSLVWGFEPYIDSGDRKKPLLEITTKKKQPRKQRKSCPSKFESYEEDDMLLQIEAMARQADAVYESNKRQPNGVRGIAGAVIIEPTMESAVVQPKIRVVDQKIDVDEKENISPEAQNNTKDAQEVADSGANENTHHRQEKVQQASVIFDKEISVIPDDVLGFIKFMTNGNVSSSRESNTVDNVSKHKASSQQDALQKFLNASTSMVSTMVAASHGRINEVHTLQYLGVTIVCIAANFMQEQGGGRELRSVMSSGGGLNPFGAKEVIQSAMFLVFVVNGQRYLAKVTNK